MAVARNHPMLGDMRYIILLFISFSVFAADMRLPTGADYPAWAKAMDLAYDQALGDHRPKFDDTEKRIAAEKKFWQLRDDNMRNWAKTVNYKEYDANKKQVINGVEVWPGEVYDYNGGIGHLKMYFIDKTSVNQNHDNFCNDVFFNAYAKINNDPSALCFVVGQYRQLRGLKPMPIPTHGN